MVFPSGKLSDPCKEFLESRALMEEQNWIFKEAMMV
jgi:hypothetical protein